MGPLGVLTSPLRVAPEIRMLQQRVVGGKRGILQLTEAGAARLCRRRSAVDDLGSVGR